MLENQKEVSASIPLADEFREAIARLEEGAPPVRLLTGPEAAVSESEQLPAARSKRKKPGWTALHMPIRILSPNFRRCH